MSALPELRASDQDRDAVAQELHDHFVAERLSDAEPSERPEQADAAKTMAGLAAVRGSSGYCATS